MTEPARSLPPSIDRILRRFQAMGREEKMQALVQYSKKLEPLPERLAELDTSQFKVPECQTPVAIVPEVHDGKIHFYAQLNVRESPTVAAVLAIVLGAVNDQPPSVVLAIPEDFVSTLMQSIGLGTREVGLSAMIQRLKRHAREAIAAAP
jgi:cysteine desulfuration protein SufE